jgi:glycosyltransferase involved in cell wall biosynthesis
MKILFVSMPSVHVTRWIENLKDTDNELYWFDVLDKGKLDTIEIVEQFIVWKQRKIQYQKGEYFISRTFPFLYNRLQHFIEVTANEKLEQIIKEIQPDIVHSFEMQSCSYPILKTMNKFPKIKWIYSCWGSDLYFYKNIKRHKTKIISVLKRVNYLHTDCERDFRLAQELGFLGKHMGVIPGGTGYKLEGLKEYKLPIAERKTILIKGYQNKFGRGLNSVKALEKLQIDTNYYNVVIFGAHKEIIEYVNKNQLPYQIYDRHELTQDRLLKVMGKSLIYIGNNISDGMPNTLLEAIIMGAFPIQSNPGGVTEEIIHHGKNGFLIKNPEDVNEIKNLIFQAISNISIIKKAAEINIDLANNKLSYEVNNLKVIEIYENSMKCE